MPAPHVLILNAGGLRSLVATALTLQPGEKVRPSFLFVHDGRPTAPIRLQHARRQAEAFGVAKVHELELPHLHRLGPDTPAGQPAASLAAPQLLLAALAVGRAHAAERVVWPVACDAEAPAMTAATERTLLCGHLADLEPQAMPALDAPLLEFTDAQTVELGAQLRVNWGLAWSCEKKGAAPCGGCAGCQRRAAAFLAAGLLDPAATPTPTRPR